MAEIAVLRTHIINYAKTRETYVAYRKAGYSKKFRQEHEEEILLHQAAKEAFNELNVKKLPTIKELQTEYAQLLADKKKAYGEYRQARAAMRELLTVKNNVIGPGDGAGRVATERKRPRPAVSWSRSKAFARTRSHRLKICVPRGLGGLPTTSAWGNLDSHRHRLPLCTSLETAICEGVCSSAIRHFRINPHSEDKIWILLFKRRYYA